MGTPAAATTPKDVLERQNHWPPPRPPDPETLAVWLGNLCKEPPGDSEASSSQQTTAL